MDFTLDDEQQAIRDITEQVLGDLSTHTRLKDLAAADDHVDGDAWATLAESGVVGASIPEAHGGAGLGFLATAMAMEAAGYHASPIPLLSTIVMGLTRRDEAGTISGAMDAMEAVCRVAAPLIGGFLLQHVSVEGPPAAGCLLAAAGIVAVYVVAPHEGKIKRE